jgi:hypothetical protein
MKILRHADSKILFQLHEIRDDQLIALNDIAKNYRLYMQELLKKPDIELVQFAPGDPTKVRESIILQISTCIAYELAFGEIVTLTEIQKPDKN